MIVKMLPEQIDQYEKLILTAIDKSVPKSDGDLIQIYNRVLEGIITHQSHCWIYYVDDIPTGICITSFISDIFTGIRSLLIYSLYSESELSFDAYTEGFLAIRDFAKFQGCKKILAYTDRKEIAHIFSKLTNIKVRIYTEMEV